MLVARKEKGQGSQERRKEHELPVSVAASFAVLTSELTSIEKECLVLTDLFDKPTFVNGFTLSRGNYLKLIQHRKRRDKKIL